MYLDRTLAQPKSRSDSEVTYRIFTA